MNKVTYYKIRLTSDAKDDIIQIKKYLLKSFKYCEYKG